MQKARPWLTSAAFASGYQSWRDTCRTIGGRFEVQSVVTEGTVFTMRLPHGARLTGLILSHLGRDLHQLRKLRPTQGENRRGGAGTGGLDGLVGQEDPPGKSFDEVIEHALDRAQCIVVLWSKTSAASRWVRLEASEGANRGILVPALIEDDVKIPLEFRRLQAAKLADWHGEPGHDQLAMLKAAVAELLGQGAASKPAAPEEHSAEEQPAPGFDLTADLASRLYLDPKTGLMWTVKDNGEDITWQDAEAYATALRLGGFSDWRLPTIAELDRLHIGVGISDDTLNIRPPFQLTSWIIWSQRVCPRSRVPNMQVFLFNRGFPYFSEASASDGLRALCVRRWTEPQ